MMYDVLILGGGPAGLTAALYAKRAGISVLVLEKTIYGGQVVNTPMVENYPGILNISGVDLAMALYEQVTGLGIEVRLEEPVSVQLDTNPKAIATARGLYEGKTVIIANGVKRRKLGCPGEEKFSGRGVSYCATCDGAFFQGAEELLAEGYRPECDVYLASSCTEEWAGDGAPKLVAELQRRNVRPFLVIDEGGGVITDPIGGVKGNFAMVGVFEKGKAGVRFPARSSGGTASSP